MSARNVIDWVIGGRGVWEYTIGDNRMSRQKRVVFSQGFGDMVFSSGTGLIAFDSPSCFRQKAMCKANLCRMSH